MTDMRTGGSLRRSLLMTASAGICLLWGAATLVRVVPPRHASFDFVQEWASARNYFEGQPVYSSLNETIPRYLGREWRIETMDVNAHPPSSVLALLPLGRLDYRTAHAAWNVISLACLAMALWWIAGRGGLELPPWTLLPILALILTSNSFTQQIIQGQLNLLLLMLFVAAWRADRNGRPALSGGLMGVAAAIKLFPAFMGLYYLARRDWRAVAGMGVSFLLLNGITVAVLGLQTYQEYFGHVVPTVQDGFRDFWPNASINGYWSKLLDAPNRHVIPLTESPVLAKALTLAAVLLVTALAAWKCWTSYSPAQRDIAFAVCILAVMLVSPITWDHYFLILILGWAILWRHLSRRLADRTALLTSIIVLATLRPRWIWDATIPGPGELVYFGDAEPSVALPVHVLTVISYQFYMLVALFLYACFRRPSGETE
ncbi:MAG: DUF2029 domain-containing protein [Pirellulaceae bacterium]|nr:DUF2029 domain-containing protein [Pirellulaceae bacterium]